MKNFLVFFLFFIPLNTQAKQQLNFLTWADYIQPSIIKEFEDETGITVNVDYIDSSFSLESKIISSNNHYDVAIPTLTPFFMRQMKFDLYRPLDYSKLENHKYNDPKIMAFEKKANNSDKYAVPFMVDTLGIGYDHTQITAIMPNAPVNSLRMIFDPNIVKNFAKCGVEMLDSPEEIISLALLYLNLDPNSESEEDLNKVFEILRKIRPFIRNINGALYFNNLGSGDNCLVLGYSGDIVHAKKMADTSRKNSDIRYILPKEGSIMILDLLAITKNSPNYENAYKFIDFIMRPKVNAEIANFIGFTSPNLASLPLIKKELRDNPNIYPLQHNLTKFYTLDIPTAKFNRLRNRTWMKFLSYE